MLFFITSRKKVDDQMIMLADLLNTLPTGLYTILAGEPQLSNPVTEVMVMASPDVGNWIVRGDLLLTSLYELNWPAQKRLIDHMLEFKAAGLIVKLNDYLQTVPSHLITYCQQHQVPLIEVHNIVFRSILQNFSRLEHSRHQKNQAAFDTKELLPLLNGTAASSQIERVMTDLNLESDQQVLLVQLQQPITNINKMKQQLKQIQLKLKNALFGIVDDCITIVLPTNQVPHVMGKLLPNLPIVTSQPVLISQLPMGYRQVQAAKIACSSLLKPKLCYVFNHFGIEQLFLTASQSELDALFSIPELASLYHQKNTLFKSLYGYLLCGQNVTHAAEQLFIHPKTLTYRLHKISNQLGIDLNDQNTVLYLSFATRYVYLKESQALHLGNNI